MLSSSTFRLVIFGCKKKHKVHEGIIEYPELDGIYKDHQQTSPSP